MKKREIRLKERFINLSNNAQAAVYLYIKCKKLYASPLFFIGTFPFAIARAQRMWYTVYAIPAQEESL